MQPSLVQFVDHKANHALTMFGYHADAIALAKATYEILLKPGEFEGQPLDLEVGVCRLVVAGPADRPVPAVPRIATKYPRAATEHFATRGVQAEVIYVQGSVEIAPLVGLADLIVDLVESGVTLRDNGLVEKETIAAVSSVLVANPSLYKLRYAEIEPFVTKLRAAVEANRKK